MMDPKPLRISRENGGIRANSSNAYPRKLLRLVTDNRQKPVPCISWSDRRETCGESKCVFVYYMAAGAPSETLSERLIRS